MVRRGVVGDSPVFAVPSTVMICGGLKDRDCNPRPCDEIG